MIVHPNIIRKRKKFLGEMIIHFNLDNRARDHLRCRYSHSANGGCAIGRKCSAELAERLDNLSRAVSCHFIFSILPPELQSLGQSFLLACQRLHDESEFWKNTGLSDKGMQIYEKILKEFCSVTALE